jgi:hypothetical protein
MNWLMLFKEVIAFYSENHTETMSTKYNITDCKNNWKIRVNCCLCVGLLEDQ